MKGSRYPLHELLRDRDGCYAALRLTAAMYHRLHAPHDCRVEGVAHAWGDVWNVNPIALARVRKLYCKNERVVLRTRLQGAGHLVTLVPVAAILVAGIRLRFLDIVINPRQSGALAVPRDATFRKGQEMGWFEHGSTIIVLAPKGFALSQNIKPAATIRMGEALMRLAEVGAAADLPSGTYLKNLTFPTDMWRDRCKRRNLLCTVARLSRKSRILRAFIMGEPHDTAPTDNNFAPRVLGQSAGCGCVDYRWRSLRTRA